MLNEPIIEVNNLGKNYGSFKAIKNLTFSVNQGELFGLIGPDGAGKTTTFHILGGILPPSCGQVRIFNLEPKQAKLQLGYLTQQFSLYGDLSISENIDYVAKIKNIPASKYIELKAKYLDLMKLTKFSNRLASQLSGGMRQKLALCCGVISEPNLLLLDEPTTGVDPISRRDFWDVLANLADTGITIVIATPYLDEAERCTKIAFINQGAIYKTGTPNELKADLALIKFEFRGNYEQIKNIHDKFVNNPYVSNATIYGDKLEILTPEHHKPAMLAEFTSADIDFTIMDINLDDVFTLSLKQEYVNNTQAKYPFVNPPVLKDQIAIAAYNLSKNFGSFQSVKNVNLEIRYGEIYGLLGANGAGKTTTIKMLCGLLNPSLGHVNLGNIQDNLKNLELKQKIGYMSQKFVMYEDLKVIENLKYYLGVYNVPPKIQQQKLDWVVTVFNLKDELNTLTGSLPGGWKQKLSFAASILHEPQILFLDEPTSGVDPFMRQLLWDYIRQLANQGTAILVTTHFLPEAENCNRLGFMVAGELVATGSPSEIKKGQQLIELTTSDTQKSLNVLKMHYEPWRVTIFGNTIHLFLDNINDTSFENMLNNVAVKILSNRIIPFSLEDAFIKIIETAS